MVNLPGANFRLPSHWHKVDGLAPGQLPVLYMFLNFFSRKTVNISAMINNTSNKFNQYQSIQHSLRLLLHAAYSYTPHSSQLFTSHVPVPCSNGSSGAIGFWASALTCTNPRMNQAPSFTDTALTQGHHDTGMMPFVSSCGSHGKLQGNQSPCASSMCNLCHPPCFASQAKQLSSKSLPGSRAPNPSALPSLHNLGP